MCKYLAGADIGTVAVKLVLLNIEDGKVEYSAYMRSFGKPLETLINMLRKAYGEFPEKYIHSISFTGSGGKLAAGIAGGKVYNEVIAVSESVKKYLPGIKSIIEIGGQSSKYLRFSGNPDNALTDLSMNNLCAAGTGSFLDQQSSRMGIRIEKEFAELAALSKHPPSIAGRCSVFAKSDMIHLQGIGTPDYDILAGLAMAVARSYRNTMIKSGKIETPCAFIGGVSFNTAVLSSLYKILEAKSGPEGLFVPKYNAWTAACGAALLSLQEEPAPFPGLGALIDYTRSGKSPSESRLGSLGTGFEQKYRTPVTLVSPDKCTDVYIGIDIGSLSTNIAVIDEESRIVARRYLPTAGRPIDAVSKGLIEIGEEISGKVKIRGVGATGSGRYLIGDCVGADIVRNEITAQAKAAVHIDPAVDTIFEIGGQDSKYIKINQGIITDFEMNKVCAAGTGSFLEEQAEKLGISIKDEFGELALKSPAPGALGDRCTVFMESELRTSQQSGQRTENLVAGLAYSIVSNYLNKVVNGKQVGEKIFFQGGVAWNKAVVAAFRKILKKDIIVPPHHDITGAIGMALLARENKPEESDFKGFDLGGQRFVTTSFVCKKCENRCEIKKIDVQGDKPLYYGARCERFDEDLQTAVSNLPDLFAERETELTRDYILPGKGPGIINLKIGIPRALIFHEQLPYWKTFFAYLGCEVIVSDKTSSRIISDSTAGSVSETCFPVKLVNGHIADLAAKGAEAFFLPVIHKLEEDASFSENYLCPLVQGSGCIGRAYAESYFPGIKIFSPSLYFSRDSEKPDREMLRFAADAKIPASALKSAMKSAARSQKMFEAWKKKRWNKLIQEHKSDLIVVAGRPYNTSDAGLNLQIARKLLRLGKIPVPMDMIPYHNTDISQHYPGMYWKYGQSILKAARFLRTNKSLLMDMIYLTNFKCGPDSFILKFMNEEMKDNPFLVLELDEHSADAGMVTRLEAFIESSSNKESCPSPEDSPRKWITNKSYDNLKTLYVPYMCEQASFLVAAVNRFGGNTELLPESDHESLQIGRNWSDGRECLPFVLTTGDFIKKCREPGFDQKKSAFLMADAAGPCRFGQYNLIQKQILEKAGFPSVDIISPSSNESYGNIANAGPGMMRLIWHSIIISDNLVKLLNQVRPYEKNKGQTLRLYEEYKNSLIEAIKSGGLKGTEKILKQAARDFKGVPVKKTSDRPLIGVVGEIYLRGNKFGNGGIIEKIEKYGGEAVVAPYSEWFLYTNARYLDLAEKNKHWRKFLTMFIKNAYQESVENKYASIFKNFRYMKEPNTSELFRNSRDFIPETLNGEGVLTIGKAVDYYNMGASGIVNVMPFSCLPGQLVSSLSEKLRKKCGGIPWFDAVFDGYMSDREDSRLESFIYQARNFSKRRQLYHP
ncbi:MAG: acyl-CoA dehydratase activase [Fibrobacterota bacterium]